MGRAISTGIVSLGAAALTEPESGFPVGGSELQLMLLARKLAETGAFEPTVYVADIEQPAREEGGVRIRPLVRMGADLRVTPLKALRILRRLVSARHQLYITRSASGVNGLVARAARRARGRYAHMCAHDSACRDAPDSTLSPAARRLHRAALKRADLLLRQTTRQQELLRESIGREAVVVPNLMPPAPDAEAERERSGVLWVGRDVDFKQPGACVELARRLEAFPFTMICQPQPGRDLQRMTSDAPANLTLIPGLPFNRIGARFARHKLYLNTSSAEGFPNTLLQAAASGMPTVSLTVDPDGVLDQFGAGVACRGDLDRAASETRRLLTDEAAWQRHADGASRFAQDWRAKEEQVIQALLDCCRDRGSGDD